MPRRNDLHSILVIGSGPIVIGQACEFDYSGTQACRVLRAEGYRVILANSNPATIMTDPDFADRTYIEPLTVEVLAAIIERERPDAVLPTLGGQTALNLAMALFERGLAGVPGTPELIGANAEAIATAEDREKFKRAMIEIGLKVPQSGIAHTLAEAQEVLAEIALPVIIRPAYILGGRGTGIANTTDEFTQIVTAGLAASPIGEVLIETSIKGWKEYELEVMRDSADNCVIICSIENIDAMGVHTGDSITVAPAMTLSDVEYQEMRNSAFACIRRVGVETGGSNVQFAVNPTTGEQVVIEMNPRVSRSSALASKATGFPIAKIAAKLAVGYTLDEIPNDITKMTPASFEPTIDYVVTKVPRWAFEKFAGATNTLGTQMRSVGESMAIGRTFPESLQKALRSLEIGRAGLNCDPAEQNFAVYDDAQLLSAVETATPDRIFQVGECIRRGMDLDVVHTATGIDVWFLDQMKAIYEERDVLTTATPQSLDRQVWRRAKRLGFSDAQLAWLWSTDEAMVRSARESAGVLPTYKSVDTCSAEFAAETPYFYSTYEDECEVRESAKDRVIILGSGPNRIGQGIEFDYCCVHASFALRQAGYETVMLNCNPETVSTDYDTSDRLYFEPLTTEDVLNVIAVETKAAGKPPKLIVSLGGQTPLKLAASLPAELIAGTSPASIDMAEDREQWNALCNQLGIAQPPGATATTLAGARAVTQTTGYPVLVRPSYVLGGRAMRIVHDDAQLADAMAEMELFGSLGREGGLSSSRPVLIDRFLQGATEVDVDAIRDHTGEVLIGGVMEHVEEAGIHSGDSACALPAQTLSEQALSTISEYVHKIAAALDVRGLINVQFAVADDKVYVIEANPRASRTVPFVAKATGVPLAMVASRVMLGATLAQLRDEGLVRPPATGHVSVKEAVLPFNRFPEVDTTLGPEMRSTGEVMGIDTTFGRAFIKAQSAAGTELPMQGRVFVSLNDRDKAAAVEIGQALVAVGCSIVATIGTADVLTAGGVVVERVVGKVSQRSVQQHVQQHVQQQSDLGDAVELINDGSIVFVINTPQDSGTHRDGEAIRKAANVKGVSLVTTVRAARAAVHGMRERRDTPLGIRSLQEYHGLSS
ncbi:MAG: carbamoyl-phosphate synthase large subunit [Ilumatobacteraceae bacterium]|nr:carbamoyl-phosphate synthase large subunit [Ilumatobacteraceae bacterium]